MRIPTLSNGDEFESSRCGRFVIIDYVRNIDILIEFIKTKYRTKTLTKTKPVKNSIIKYRGDIFILQSRHLPPRISHEKSGILS